MTDRAPTPEPHPFRHSGGLRRVVNYLRISITDRCNERCLYCMPEGFNAWKPRDEILSYEELLEAAEVAVSFGFQHFRITGGEPLIRRDAEHFCASLARLPGVQGVHVSTNGTRLAALAPALRAGGVQSLNVSLDAIDPSVYRRITGHAVEPVLEGLKAARAAGFERIKLNCVLMRGVNEREIWPLIEFAASFQAPIRFIELMPVSRSDVLSDANFLPIGEVLALMRERDRVEPIETALGLGPARYHRLVNTGAVVGLIGAMTQLHFCDACNKMRLTADGMLRPCLGNHGEHDLRSALRSGPRQAVRDVFHDALSTKPPEHVFRDNYQPGRIMTAIGG